MSLLMFLVKLPKRAFSKVNYGWPLYFSARGLDQKQMVVDKVDGVGRTFDIYCGCQK